MRSSQRPLKPPRIAERILDRILDDDIWHTPLGDFEECYRSFALKDGRRRADTWYWAQILRLLPQKITHIMVWRWHMLRSDMKMAIRAVKHNKGYTFINMTGLAVGIASCLLILLFVRHELSYDRFHDKAPRICRVGMKADVGTNSFTVADGPAPLAEALVRDLPEVALATRLFRIRRTYLTYGDKQFKEEKFFYADPNIFEVFTLPMVAGDPQTALAEPDSIVITPAMAEKYFGSTDVLGKVLQGENERSYQVTGVVRELPTHSHFKFDFLASSLSYPPSEVPDWFNNGTFTYLVLDENADFARFDAKLLELSKKYIEPTIQEGFGMSFEKFLETGNYFGFFAQPLLDIHLRSHIDNELEANGSYSTVVIFAAIALVILLVACINFTNLATARAGKRANEVGVRKVVGSQKRQLIQQFLTESLVLSMAAFGLAVILVRLTLPLFNRIMDKEISMAVLGSWYVLPVIVGFAVLIGILAGAYPAFMLASLRPVAVLKGKMQSGARERRLRNVLVVFQFFATITLFISTLVIYGQLHYLRNKNLGFEQEHMVILQNAQALGDQQAAFKAELRKNPDIIEAAYSSGGPFMSLSAHIFRVEGQDTNTNYTLVNIAVDHDFKPTYRFFMDEGRFFSLENTTDASAVVLNQAAVRALGITNPVGKRIIPLSDQNEPFTIIGTVKDFHLQSLREAIRPMGMFLLQEEPGIFLTLRIRPGDTDKILRAIEDRWEAFNPGQPVDFVFLDERLNRDYRGEILAGNVFSAFAGLAIFIACLGLFGLASFMAERRTKEIGVRKVLGASVGGIVVLLSREYVKWLGIANLLAWPLAFYGMHHWLRNFAFRTTLAIWPFLLSGAAALAIALVTVSYQSIRAARAHPIKSLRYE